MIRSLDEPDEMAAHTVLEMARDPGAIWVVLFDGELGSWEKLA